MQVIQTTFPADWPETQEKEEVNLSYIETRLDGSIIFNRRYQDFPQNELPHKFAFPKRYIAKINSCLLDNFWQDLRSEDTPDCFTWHRTSEGRVWYLADRGETIDQSYRDRLVDLLNSQSGDVASVLLAYTCFSILHPIAELNARLSREHMELLSQLLEEFKRFTSALELAFDPDINIAFAGSIELAMQVGVPSGDILKSKAEIDNFFEN